MELHVERRTNRTIVFVQGNVGVPQVPELRERLTSLLTDPNVCGYKPVSLDLSGVELFDGDAVELLGELQQQGAQCQPGGNCCLSLLRIINPSLSVRESLLRSGKLDILTGWGDDLQQFDKGKTRAQDGEDSFGVMLERIRTVFPAPVSDPLQDAYLAQALARGLNRIDSLKHGRPYLGKREKPDYDKARAKGIGNHMGDVEQTIDELAEYLEGLTLFGHPLTQENVIPQASIPAIMGQVFSALYNPNVIWDEYSHRVSEAEVEAVAMSADLVGYNPAKAAGMFTWGGTGTLFYGIKLGIEKALPGAFTEGVRQDVKLVVSEAGHYSKLNALGWLGVGTKNLVTVPTDADNAMDVQALRRVLEKMFARGDIVACIIPTLGTTDAFGLDNLLEIRELRDELTVQYGLRTPPHIHADAVIGWAFSVFNDYDFAVNDLNLSDRTLRSLWDVRSVIQHLGAADSMGLDFHKTGYAPYISSLFLVRDQAELDLLARDKEAMPYLFQYGTYHPGVFTMETSRGAGGVMSALANLKLFGKQGYRVILAHTVSMAEVLRSKVERWEHGCVVNSYNHGPVTLFRVYPDGYDPARTWEREMTDPDLADQLKAHNEYNRKLFHIMHRKMEEGRCLALSITNRYRESVGGVPGVALKSYVMSPFVEERSMDSLIECLVKAREELENE